MWEAERLGFAAVWCGEAYGTDAVSPVAWVLAADQDDQGRHRHHADAGAHAGLRGDDGNDPAAPLRQPFPLRHRPARAAGGRGLARHALRQALARTREYVAIIRQILERRAPLEFKGEQYRIPYDGPGATGLGKPLRSIVHGDPSLKIYTASIGPAGLRLAGEIADGTLPFFMSPEKAALIVGPVAEGIAKAGPAKTLADFDLAPYVRVALGDDLARCRDMIRPNFALYIGGMGARSRNFYNDLARRMGYEAAAATIQDLYLAGQRKEAEAAVPDALIDETSLVGPKERIRDRLQAWQELARDHRIGSLVLAGASRKRCASSPRPRPEMTELVSAIVGAVAASGFALVRAPEMTALLEPAGLRHWPAFAASWNDLGLDAYMADGGRYRRRRFGVFRAAADGVVRKPHQPHYQSRDYNPLNGGVERWFEPITEAVAGHPAMRAILGASHALFDRMTPEALRPAAWHVEIHQFRIEARPGAAGPADPGGNAPRRRRLGAGADGTAREYRERRDHDLRPQAGARSAVLRWPHRSTRPGSTTAASITA